MPPKRPPPLPRSLFTGGGPLSPSTITQPPSPSTVHPEFITDAHTAGEPLKLDGSDATVKPPVTGSVAVAVGSSPAEKGTGKHRVASARLIECPSEETRDDVQSSTHLPAVDLVVPNKVPLTEAGWDRVDEAVNEIDGGWSKVEKDVAEGTPSRKILLSGVLPPPLTKPSSPLLQSDEYHIHCGRLAQLSLHSDVVLKALPPIVDKRVAGSNAWWEDTKELERVVKMYIAPAIETFGTHRIIFGSQPALPPTDPDVIVPISGAAWYTLLRRCVSELGEEHEAMTAIMGVNAVKLYDL